MDIQQDEIANWLWDLFLRRDALTEYEEPMTALAKACRTQEEFQLIKHSMEQLIALSEAQLVRQILSAVVFIRENILDERPLAIVATAWGEHPDSSQALLQKIKVHFWRNRNIRFFNSVNAYEKKKHQQEFPRFLLIDEFCGTGNTIANRLDHIIKNAKQFGIEPEPHVCILFGMERAKEFLLESGYDVHFCTTLKAGISGHFSGEERQRKLSAMKRLETGLSPEINGTQLPSLGYGKAEALFFVKNENAPNSNFPILWWPLDVDGNDRITITQRAEL